MKKSQLRHIIRKVIKEQINSELSNKEEPINWDLVKRTKPEPPSLPINKQVRPELPRGEEPINKDFEKDITKINPQAEPIGSIGCTHPNARKITSKNCKDSGAGAMLRCITVNGGQVPQVGDVITNISTHPVSGPTYYLVETVSPPSGIHYYDKPTVNANACGYNCDANNNCTFNASGGLSQYPDWNTCNQYCNNPSVRYECGETCVGCSTLGIVPQGQHPPYPTWPDNGNGTCCKELLPGDPGYATASTTPCAGSCPDLSHYQCDGTSGGTGTCRKWDPCARTYEDPQGTIFSMNLIDVDMYNILVHVEGSAGPNSPLFTYGVNGQPQTLAGCQACCNAADDWCRA